MLDVCCAYAVEHEIVFNYKKTVGMVFDCKTHKCLQQPHICINNHRIDFVDRVKYLGVILQCSLKDDADIQRQIKSLYCAANRLRTTFHKCSTPVKNILYRAYQARNPYRANWAIAPPEMF